MTNTKLLKDLTQTTYDSAESYRKAGIEAEKPAFKSAFERRCALREQTLEQLNTALKARGEDPITSTSLSASAHQTFWDITDALSEGDSAIISRVEEGEEYLAKKFAEALSDDSDADLDPSTRALLQTAYREISEGERFADMLEKRYA